MEPHDEKLGEDVGPPPSTGVAIEDFLCLMSEVLIAKTEAADCNT